MVTVFNTCSMSSRPIYDPQPDKNSPQKCHDRSRFWRIRSIIFVQTLSHLTQLCVYIIRRQYYAVVVVVNACNISNRLIHYPQPGKNTPRETAMSGVGLSLFNINHFRQNTVSPHPVSYICHEEVILCCGNSFQHVEHVH